MERAWSVIEIDIVNYLSNNPMLIVVGAVAAIIGIRLLRFSLKIAGAALIVLAVIYFAKILF
jgi:hypothetical protein